MKQMPRVDPPPSVAATPPVGHRSAADLHCVGAPGAARAALEARALSDRQDQSGDVGFVHHRDDTLINKSSAPAGKEPDERRKPDRITVLVRHLEV